MKFAIILGESIILKKKNGITYFLMFEDLTKAKICLVLQIITDINFLIVKERNDQRKKSIANSSKYLDS